MTLFRNSLVLCLSTAGLASPSSAGQVATATQHLTALDGALDHDFGCSVAVDGDTLVVGARRNVFGGATGGAYVYVKIGSSWVLQQELAASDGIPQNTFGSDVAISGDTIAVAAPSTSLPGGLTSAGELYVYTRSGTTWTEQQHMSAPTPTFGGFFGTGLAIQGDTLLAGSAYVGVPGVTAAGSVFEFSRSGSTWSYHQTLSAGDPHTGDRFGYALSLSGNRVAIGAYGDDSAGANEGSVYVFERNGGVWLQTTKLVPSGFHNFDNFGAAVALDGDTLAAGAPQDSTSTSIDAGNVLVFTFNGSSWSQNARFSAAESVNLDAFGASVALNAGTLVVGALSRREISSYVTGATYVFNGAGATWTETYKLYAGETTPDAFYGSDVAVQSGRVVVGAPNGNEHKGSAFVFDPLSNVGQIGCTGSSAPSPCPCHNLGAVYHGCKNSSFTLGGLLFATGTASVANDTLTLYAYNLLSGNLSVVFQGDSLVNGGLGMSHGDGLLCINGNLRRVSTVSAVLGIAVHPAPGSSLSVLGFIPPTGATVEYQVIYRDGFNFCTSETFNSTNACKVVWTP